MLLIIFLLVLACAPPAIIPEINPIAPNHIEIFGSKTIGQAELVAKSDTVETVPAMFRVIFHPFEMFSDEKVVLIFCQKVSMFSKY